MSRRIKKIIRRRRVMGDLLTFEQKTAIRNTDNNEVTIPLEIFKKMQFKAINLGNENVLLKRRIRELEDA